MSSQLKKASTVDDPISTEENSLESSISLSVGENSIRIKEKPNLGKESDPSPVVEWNADEKWWLKRPGTRLEVNSSKETEVKIKQTLTPSPDVSSSMREFLEKEKMCKAMHKNEVEVKDKDDTLCDILASAAFDKYPSDFENATDEDIGSILEEMSKIAGALSPNSAPEQTKSGNSSKHPTEQEKSVEELLQEAEKLVRKNTSSLSKSTSKSDTLVLNNNLEDQDNLNRVKQLEADIFQLIEQEVHKESEKIKKSPKYEKKRDASPDVEVVYENLDGLRPPKTLEFQRRKFEEQKVEISSSSDLDDPIERHSKSEELKRIKKLGESRESLQKEITDVDKDFFENLLQKSKEKMEGGISGSSSFGQEDFSHFLKLLQGQGDKKEHESKETASFHDLLRSAKDEEPRNVEERLQNTEKSPEFPEKEITEILRKELSEIPLKAAPEISETISNESGKHLKLIESVEKRNVSGPTKSPLKSKDTNIDETPLKSKDTNIDETPLKSKDTNIDSKKVVNSKNELYKVGLTSRLELFADAIPKLIAEKSNENSQIDKDESSVEQKNNEVPKSTLSAVRTTNIILEKLPQNNIKDSSTQESRKGTIDLLKVDSTVVQKREIRFCKSRSYDQICKPPSKNSQENIKVTKSAEVAKRAVAANVRRSATLKPKLSANKPVSKLVPKGQISPKLKSNAIKVGSTSSLPATCKSAQLRSADGPMAGGDTRYTSKRTNWEALCREERHKNALLRQQLESEAKMYKSQMDSMRTSFETELFTLKRQNIILKTKVDELSMNERHIDVHSKPDTTTVFLEKEVERQENLIRGYETENKKLMQETKRMQEEMKKLQQKQKSGTLETNEMQRYVDRIRDLEEATLKLNLEVSELKQKNGDLLLRNEDLTQQNSLLNDELEMFKEQLRAKNDFITDRLQTMTSVELDLTKQLEELKVKLSSKMEQLRTNKSEFEQLQQRVLPLEKELLELRVKEGNLQEKLQVAKSHVEREKQLSQKLKDQVILDNKKIMDLNRQVRELERILKRKNPDSVSALILTANSEQEKIGSEKVKLLEERIAALENEIKAKEETSQQKLVNLQEKFSEMKERYSTQIMELEGRLLETTVRDGKVYNDVFTQTVSKSVENKGVDTQRKDERVPSIEKEDKKDQRTVKVGPKSQNAKEDAHLIATIRGLKLELANKEKIVSKLTREYQELQKTNRRLQKEREKLLNDRRTFRSADLEKANAKLLASRSTEGNDQNSNVYQNGHIADSGLQRLSASTQRLYDPLQYTENSDNNTVKKLLNENEILREELNKINKDFMALKNKRLHDLNLLQEEHEREMAAIVKEYSVKFGDSKVVKLQGQINTQVAIIAHLKQQIEKLRDYKEQVVVLKAEREHLENKVKSLNEKVKYLSTPGTEQLQLLQDKITILQQRHESREMTLQSLVRDLLRSRTQCKDCKNEKGKNRQLCYFRQELDHILGMLQEIANVH